MAKVVVVCPLILTIEVVMKETQGGGFSQAMSCGWITRLIR